MDEHERRTAQNESLFREVNERVNEVAESIGDHLTEYICECADADCAAQVSLTPAEYERVRADAAQFFVKPRHFDPTVEKVVLEHEAYWIVRKHGQAGETAERLDPRSR